MSKYILRCYSDNEEYNGGCGFALVELTPEVVSDLTLKIITLDWVRTHYPGCENIKSMTHWGPPLVEYFDPNIDIECSAFNDWGSS